MEFNLLIFLHACLSGILAFFLVVSLSGFDIRVVWPYEFGSDLSSIFWKNLRIGIHSPLHIW